MTRIDLSGQGHCVLCGFFGKLTEEHVFAQWLGRRSPSLHRQSASQLEILGKETEVLHDFPPNEQAVAVLCSKCNNEWGSRLQNKTTPILSRLIAGNWWQMSPAERSQLARWLTCFVMIREFVHSELVSIHQDERERFRKTSIPTSGTEMWMAPFKARANHYRSWHSAFRVMREGGSKPERCNAHFTMLAVSQVLFFVFGTSHAESLTPDSAWRGEVRKCMMNAGLIQLFPVVREIISLPRVLADEEFEQLKLSALQSINKPFPRKLSEHGKG